MIGRGDTNPMGVRICGGGGGGRGGGGGGGGGGVGVGDGIGGGDGDGNEEMEESMEEEMSGRTGPRQGQGQGQTDCKKGGNQRRGSEWEWKAADCEPRKGNGGEQERQIERQSISRVCQAGESEGGDEPRFRSRYLSPPLPSSSSVSLNLSLDSITNSVDDQLCQDQLHLLLPDRSSNPNRNINNNSNNHNLFQFNHQLNHFQPHSTNSFSFHQSQSQPLKTQLLKTQPLKTQPLKTQPLKTQPLKTQTTIPSKRSHPSKRSKSQLDKKFNCDWPGCFKHFSRPDHLTRHRLNHEPEKIYACPSCPRTFVRADLLARHIDRHQKRFAFHLSAPPLSSPNSSFYPLPTPFVPSLPLLPHSAPLILPSPTHHLSPELPILIGPSKDTLLNPPHSSPYSLPVCLPIPPSSPLSFVPQPDVFHPNRPTHSSAAPTSLPIPYPNMAGPHAFLHPPPVSLPVSMHQENSLVSCPALMEYNTETPYSHVSDAPMTHDTRTGARQTRTSQHSLTEILLDPAPIPGPSQPGHPTMAATQAYEHPIILTSRPTTDAHWPPNHLPGTFSSYGSMGIDVPFFTGQDFRWLFDGALEEVWVNGGGMGYGPVGEYGDPGGSDRVDQSTTGSSSCWLSEASGIQNSVDGLGGGPRMGDVKEWQGVILESNGALDRSGDLPSSGCGSSRSGDWKGKSKQEQEGQFVQDAVGVAVGVGAGLRQADGSVRELDGSAAWDKEDGAKDESVWISEETRRKILEAIKNGLKQQAVEISLSSSSSSPPGTTTSSAGLVVETEDCRLTKLLISKYLGLYWSKVQATSFPILHRPTFKTSEASVYLLCCMMCLGAHFTDVKGHELATCVHEEIRKQVISSSEFRPHASLDTIQVTLLLILYGKMCSTRRHHEMAHIFWGSTLTMYRRSALFSSRVIKVPDEFRENLEVQWRAWIEEESTKRAAYAAFLIDVQHAAIFRHAPTLSAFQIQHVLPADEEEWTAPDSVSWNRLRNSNNKQRGTMLFMSALKASLVPGLEVLFLNPFSRVVILHGLISVAFDLQWRDVFMNGLVVSADHQQQVGQGEGNGSGGQSLSGKLMMMPKDWRETISASFNGWKSRLDKCLVTMTSSSAAHQILRASISIYALAHIILSIDVHELQIYAGAQKVLGIDVGPHVAQSTKERVIKWANTKEGRASTWHAAHFLRSSLIHLNESSDLLHCLHYTWACYISALTVYAYGNALERQGQGRTGSRDCDCKWPNGSDGSEIRDDEVDRYKNDGNWACAMAYLNQMCTENPEGLKLIDNKEENKGLMKVIYEVIKCSQWEIGLEGARILFELF